MTTRCLCPPDSSWGCAAESDRWAGRPLFQRFGRRLACGPWARHGFVMDANGFGDLMSNGSCTAFYGGGHRFLKTPHAGCIARIAQQLGLRQVSRFFGPPSMNYGRAKGAFGSTAWRQGRSWILAEPLFAGHGPIESLRLDGQGDSCKGCPERWDASDRLVILSRSFTGHRSRGSSGIAQPVAPSGSAPARRISQSRHAGHIAARCDHGLRVGQHAPQERCRRCRTALT